MATTTQQLITLLTIMLIMNVGLHLFQGGLTEAGSETIIYTSAGTPYSRYASAVNSDDNYLPSEEFTSSDSTGNLVTDTWRNIKNWFKASPLGFVGDVLKQPYGFLTDVEVPSEIALAVATIWYLIALMLIVSWWGGR